MVYGHVLIILFCLLFYVYVQLYNALLRHGKTFYNETKKVSEYDQETPQSHTADLPTA